MRTLVFLSALLLSFGAAAQPKYEPQVGQAGKDVIWVPTPDDVVERMLTMAQVTPQDNVWDLGAGDGKIAIMAAKKFGARATGIEYNPDMVKHANANAEKAGVAGSGQGKAVIRHGDIFATDFSSATVITLYLLPALNMKLRPQILAMKPGTRVVSYTFTMGEWEPDATIKGRTFDAYLWTVPANVAGRWVLTDEQNRVMGTLDLVQRFQKIAGTITLRNGVQPVLGAFVHGTELGFSYVEPDGAFRAMRLEVAGDRVAGRSRLDESAFAVTARRS